MKLFSRNLTWFAGRPVIILSKKTADKLNLSLNDRVKLSYKNKKIYSVVDIFDNLIKDSEVGLSKEISSFFKNRSGDSIEISSADMFLGGKIIKKKLEGKTLSEKEVKILMKEITNNNLTEAEIAFFVSAEKLRGMSDEEIINLTKAMVSTGKKINFDKKIIADKHCIGGIAGNRTTPIVISICASAGLTLPKTSSRAITSASGTADVIELISKIEFSIKELKNIVSKTNACLAWNGTLGLSPTDDKIIHIERLLNLDVEPQLIASILSKKIAAGSNHILIDIPYGGGKMKNKKMAKKLAKKFDLVAKEFNLKLKCVYTGGKLPIGKGFGPVLELLDVMKVLKNSEDLPQDLKRKSIYLAASLMSLCGIKFAKSKAKKILNSGQAYEKFKQIINAQNNSDDFEKRIKKLKLAKIKKDILAEKTGKIVSVDNKEINSLCRILGTPEIKSAGVYLYRDQGYIKKGEKIMTLYSESDSKLKEALKFIKEFNPVKIK